jgi:hypothetical protein
MPAWTDPELTAIGDARELEICSRRRDGSLSPQVTIWAVRVGDEIYARSVNGPDATWYRNAVNRSTGRIWSGGVEREVGFAVADSGLEEAIDAAYNARFGAASSHTQAINAPLARQTTIRLDPSDG